MAHIIRFPTTSDLYPARSPDLEEPEAVLLLGLRWWVADVREHVNPLPRLRHGMGLAGASDAAVSIDALMSIIGGTARRPLEVHGPGCDCLSADEQQMLHAASLVQAGDSPRAEQVLRTALLSAQGADMALGPLQGIGRLFSAARLLLRRRRAPACTAASVLH